MGYHAVYSQIGIYNLYCCLGRYCGKFHLQITAGECILSSKQWSSRTDGSTIEQICRGLFGRISEPRDGTHCSQQYNLLLLSLLQDLQGIVPSSPIMGTILLHHWNYWEMQNQPKPKVSTSSSIILKGSITRPDQTCMQHNNKWSPKLIGAEETFSTRYEI